MKHFDELLSAVEKHPVRKVAVAAAQDPFVIEAVVEAKKRNIAESVLIGDEELIHTAASAAGVW